MSEIKVYCDDASSRSEAHAGREVNVTTFARLTDEWWALSGDRYAGEERAHKVGSGALDTARTTEKVRVDGSVIPNEGVDYDHLKYRLRCELCGLDFQCTEPRAAPVLDTLAGAGIDRVSLKWLLRLLE